MHEPVHIIESSFDFSYLQMAPAKIEICTIQSIHSICLVLYFLTQLSVLDSLREWNPLNWFPLATGKIRPHSPNPTGVACVPYRMRWCYHQRPPDPNCDIFVQSSCPDVLHRNRNQLRHIESVFKMQSINMKNSFGFKCWTYNALIDLMIRSRGFNGHCSTCCR